MLALCFFRPFLALVDAIVPLEPQKNITAHIAMLHTIFNISAALLFLPFTNQITKFAQRFIKETAKEENAHYKLPAILPLTHVSSDVYAFQIQKEIAKMADRVIDIAFRYCYETPESFAKAFARFHGATPSEVRAGKAPKPFLPLTITISVQGGSAMECKIVHKEGFSVIGYEEEFSEENSYKEIPAFWNRMHEALGGEYGIGEFGICIDGSAGGTFRYLIAGRAPDGVSGAPAGVDGSVGQSGLPSGMTTYALPAGDWAVFDCVGALPAALQNVNTRIFKEWLPANPDWELAGKASVEWYSAGDMSASDYKSAIWIPVKRK